jgi:phosphate starvation-inducible protein PhoH
LKFDERDIVRHKLVRSIVRAYENEENEAEKQKRG